MGLLSIVMLVIVGVFLLKQISISFHLVGFSCILLSWTSRQISLELSWRELAMYASSQRVSPTVMSSMYLQHQHSRLARELTMSRNNIGPRTLPCGIPAGTGFHLDEIPSKQTLWEHPVRKLAMLWTKAGWTSNWRTMSIKMLWSTLSKPLLRS